MAGIPFVISNNRKIDFFNTNDRNILILRPQQNTMLLIDTIRVSAVMENFSDFNVCYRLEIGFSSNYGSDAIDISREISCKDFLNFDIANFSEIPVELYRSIGSLNTLCVINSSEHYFNGDEFIWQSHTDYDDIKITYDRIFFIKATSPSLNYGANIALTVEGEI
jgi:hypothetical protein